jgi:hypothetical protein
MVLLNNRPFSRRFSVPGGLKTGGEDRRGSSYRGAQAVSNPEKSGEKRHEKRRSFSTTEYTEHTEETTFRVFRVFRGEFCFFFSRRTGAGEEKGAGTLSSRPE